MAKVDVIVPIYNAKKYLAKCIRSIQKQTFTDWRLILVDDGSTDGSAELCDRFAARDNRIYVMHQENSGSLKARLNGVSKATGEFVAFVDADDLTEPEMLQKLLEIQIQYSADIVSCGYKTLSRRGWIKRSRCKEQGPAILSYGKEEAVRIASSIGTLTMWGKLYRRSFFENAQDILKTIPNIFWGEDTMINAAVFGKANTVVLVSDELYDYRVGGRSSRSTEKLMHELAELYRWRKNYLLNASADNKYHIANLAQVLNFAIYYAHYSKKMPSREKICSELAEVIADIEQIAPDFWHKDAYDLNIPMTDREFKNIYRESPLVVIKQMILRIL